MKKLALLTAGTATALLFAASAPTMTALRELTICRSFPGFLMELPEPLTYSHTERITTSLAVSSVVPQDENESRYEALASKKPQKRATKTRAKKSSKRIQSRRGTVLVVDDVPDVTEMIQLLLKHAGYDVATAGSAKAALQMARKQHFDLVISDIGMPEMNGYELATALRDLAAYNSTPLIAVTGYSEYDDRGRAMRAGFNVHLAKPIEPTQLLNLMNELLSQIEPGTNH